MRTSKLALFITAIIGVILIFIHMFPPELNSGNGSQLMYSTASTDTISPIMVNTVSQAQVIEHYPPAETAAVLATPNISSEPLVLNEPYIAKQWALQTIGITEIWRVTKGNPDILVAILDTGIDDNHPELVGKVAMSVDLTGDMTPDDANGHGTHIAGIITAESDNNIGIAGIAPRCRLINVKVADDKGRCQAAVVAEAIIWATDHGANIINISVEFDEPSGDLENAVNYAWDHGVLLVAAAGNSGNQLPAYPAYYQNCIAVAATRDNGTLAPLSNTGDWVDIAAPGFNIYSTLPNDRYDYKSGTSFATAYVSGLAALLLDLATDDNFDGRLNEEVLLAIELGCQPFGMNGVGRGLINAANSFNTVTLKTN
jgi:thermitase